MDPHTAEDGELEDGEICDDETEESAPSWRGKGGRPGRGAPPLAPRPQQHSRGVRPLMGPPPDFRLLVPYHLGPHGPFPPGHRQQCGPSGPDRPPAASPAGPPLGLGPHGEPSPRASFWERSHGALGRFRHRVLPNAGRGGWSRGGRGGNSRAPPGRYGPGESHGSPSRKPKQLARTRPRKVVHSVPKPDTSVDESFEDLLSKYKQIQLELECIRNEETMALGPTASPVADEVPQVPDPSPAEMEELEKAEKKVFQAFNIKPLRQKLPTPAELDDLQRKWAEPEAGDGAEAEGEHLVTDECEERTRSLCGPSGHQTVPDHNNCGCPEPLGPGATPPSGSRVTTRSASSSAAAAAAIADRTRTRSKPADLDPTKNVPKPSDRAKPASNTGLGKPLPTKKMTSTGDQPLTAGGAAESERRCEVPGKEASVCCGASPASSEDSTTSADRPVLKVEEEELSELQLRLLALQSASKKWQQKEQQVMKRSKDRISRAAPERSPGGPPPSRSRVTTRSAAAAERNRTRSKLADWDRIKSGTKPPNRDRDRAKPALKGPSERNRPQGKPHVTKKTTSPGSVGKQACRKQQLRTWKLQQHREEEEEESRRQEQEERRRQEEEERRKREEEIRRIRDLSNQDEQYNRFMKLVGGRKRPRSKSRDGDHRKSAGKGGVDSSGNLYQYDNYDEVAMDTDSETGSPVSSPNHSLTTAEEAGRHLELLAPDGAAFGAELSQAVFSTVLPGLPPPPPPPLPPPDESEPPPKPPFADEEEEEEMLLRETCLMSMAHKRVAASERSSSGPPSPSCAPPSEVQQPVRGNLSTVSLNMVPQAHRKFSRGAHAGRAPLVLPRHKAVVVSLNDSDDSDSDVDACGSLPSVFGGLEFMIKEARRTVEAAKPRAASGFEKENNPIRTTEVHDEAKQVESAPWREEISREKSRTPRDGLSSRPAAGPLTAPDFHQRPAEDPRPAETEQRLCKLRELLERDEAVLGHLLQQELKKNESLKASETKVSKLREQLQASERIANGNRTLLRKLQEQVRRVEQRVSMKRSVVQRVEQEVLQAQLHTAAGANQRADVGPQVKKPRRVATPPLRSARHLAELIAHRQRLQQLESEYALKIQKLKAAQALRNRTAAAAAEAPPPPRLSDTPGPAPQVLPPTGPLAPPQPSLHDLTQDKLALDSEDGVEPDDAEPALAAPAAGARRSSLRRSSGSFTKPHLDVSSTVPVKDGGSKPKATVSKVEVPTEMWAGLNVDALKQAYQHRAPIGQLLLTELHRLGQQVDTPPAGQVLLPEVEPAPGLSGGSDLRPVPFGAYRSPLLVFRSYRFSPYYRTKEKLSLSSVTFSNAVEVTRSFCRFDLTGTCNHDGCSWQHMRDVTLTGTRLFEDILSYSLSLIGCSESSTEDDISAATESYMKKLFGSNRDRMNVDQKAVLLVSKVNESHRHVPPFTTWKDPRRWRPRPRGAGGPDNDSCDEAADARLMPRGASEDSGVSLDVCVTSEDRRYFLSETDDVWNLESSVVESPGDTQLWIKLAFKYLSQSDSPAEENLEAALNTLSRALERNCEDPEVWSHYLSLFSRRGSSEEVQEMCEMAAEHAAHHRVWWQYLSLQSSFQGKDSVCERLLHFLRAEAEAGVSEKLSFQLMEAQLYRVQLSVFSGRVERGVMLLQCALKDDGGGVAAHLTPAHRALLWLAYIHLVEFHRLPCALYDPAESGPARLLRPRSFLLPWRTPQEVRTPLANLLALFQDGVRQCSGGGASDRDTMQACMPLHTNLIHLYRLLHRLPEAVSLCESLLCVCPDSCVVRCALADLHMCNGEEERALSVWLQALSDCPHDAHVFYCCCCFLMDQGKSSAMDPLFKRFIMSLCEDEQNQGNPTHILRDLLGFSCETFTGSVIKKNLQETLSQQNCFLHLIHCRWQWLQGAVDQAVEAFERALGSNLQLEELQQLWTDYLLFSRSVQAGCGAAARRRTFSELVLRCLSTVPTRLEVPFNAAMFWSCYRFHNQVVSLYLGCIPQSQHASLLERLHSSMPNNTELGLRLLLLLWQDGLTEQLRFQARMLSSSSPRCVSVWKILLAVLQDLKQQVEVRVVYQQALRHLPLCADLWKHRFQLEAVVGGASERLQQLVEACRQTGVSVSLSGGVGGI